MAKKTKWDKFLGPDGEFVSTQSEKNIFYLYELMEWIYYHNNKTDDEKMKDILNMEMIVKETYAEHGLGFKPLWSIKLKRKMVLDINRAKKK